MGVGKARADHKRPSKPAGPRLAWLGSREPSSPWQGNDVGNTDTLRSGQGRMKGTNQEVFGIKV